MEANRHNRLRRITTKRKQRLNGNSGNSQRTWEKQRKNTKNSISKITLYTLYIQMCQRALFIQVLKGLAEVLTITSMVIDELLTLTPKIIPSRNIGLTAFRLPVDQAQPIGLCSISPSPIRLSASSTDPAHVELAHSTYLNAHKSKSNHENNLNGLWSIQQPKHYLRIDEV